ncbi:MAG: hypothetical protein R3B89_35120 [Polyangiaceae bacterium]
MPDYRTPRISLNELNSEQQVLTAIQEMLRPEALEKAGSEHETEKAAAAAGPSGAGGAPGADADRDHAAPMGTGDKHSESEPNRELSDKAIKYGFSVGEAWESFADIERVATDNPVLWLASQPHVGEIAPVKQYERQLEKAVFSQAKNNLSYSEKWVKGELKALGGDEKSSSNPAARTKEQKQYLKEVRNAAEAVALAEKAKLALAKVDVYDTEAIEAGIEGSSHPSNRVTPFRPDDPHKDYTPKAPKAASVAKESPALVAGTGHGESTQPDALPESGGDDNQLLLLAMLMGDERQPSEAPVATKSDVSPQLTSKSDVPTDTPTTMVAEGASGNVMNWSAANQMWTRLNAEIAALKEQFPAVQALSATEKLDSFIEEEDETKAFNSVTLSLNTVLDAISNARTNLDSVNWYDLNLAVQQVLVGSGAEPSVDWNRPVAALAAKEALKGAGESKWWEKLGIAAGIAGMILGGPIGLVLGAVELAVAVTSSAQGVLETKNLNRLAVATAKPSLGLVSAEHASERKSIALTNFALTVILAAAGAVKGLLCRIRADSSSFRAAPDTVLAA